MPELLSIEEFEYRTILGSTSDAFVVGIGHVQFLPTIMLSPGIDMGTHPFGLPLPHYNFTYLHPKSDLRINEDNSEYLKALANEIRKTITNGNSYRDLHTDEVKPLGYGEHVSVKVDTFDQVTISVRSANRIDTLTMSLEEFGERMKFPPRRSINIQRNPEVQETIRSFDYAYYTKQGERLSKKIKMAKKPFPVADDKINSCYAQEGKYYQAYNTNRPTRYVYSKKMYQDVLSKHWEAFGYGFTKPFRNFVYMVSHPIETAKNTYNAIANATPLEIAGCLGHQLLRSPIFPYSGVVKHMDMMEAMAYDAVNGTFTATEMLGEQWGDIAFDATTAAAGAGAAKVVGVVGKGASTVGKGAKAVGKGAKAVKQAAKKGATAFKSFTKNNFRHNLGKLTGNIPANSQAHHVFPQKHLNEFSKAGINIHDPKFGAWWDTSSHLKNASDYNKAWGKFLKTSPTRPQILDKGRELMQYYGISVNY